MYEAHGLCVCPDDIERYIKGPCWKWVMPFFAGQEKPPIPPNWSVNNDTNLTHSEIFALENACFQLPPKERITSTWLFTYSAPQLDMSQIRIPDHPDFIPPTRVSKVVRRSSSASSAKQKQMVASAKAMHATVLKLTMILQSRFGCIITLQSKSKTPTPNLPCDSEFLSRVQLRKLLRYDFQVRPQKKLFSEF